MKDENGVRVKITMNVTGNPEGKLADAELQFTSGPLAGMCLIGIGVWQKRERPSELSITMPSRKFMSGGQSRTYNLLRIDNPNPAPPEDAPREVKNAYYAPLHNVWRLVSEAYMEAASKPGADAPAQVGDGDDIPF